MSLLLSRKSIDHSKYIAHFCIKAALQCAEIRHYPQDKNTQIQQSFYKFVRSMPYFQEIFNCFCEFGYFLKLVKRQMSAKLQSTGAPKSKEKSSVECVLVDNFVKRSLKN